MSSNQDSMYAMTNPQNSVVANMFNPNSYDFIPDMDPSKQQTKPNGYDANSFRPFSSFPVNAVRQRHITNPSLAPQYRENYYQNSSDAFSVTPSQASPGYDFTPQSGNYKPFPDSYGHSNPALPSSHSMANLGTKSNIVQHTNTGKPFNAQGQYSGMQLTSQTPFGPHIPANMPLHMTSSLSNGNASLPPNSASAASGVTTVPGQEEISTIFVVGFPDDMQEREFQNMFTFSQGFEAATLKIPNKDNTNYAANASRLYGGSSDPFSVLAPNQGGIEGSRDSNWPGDESSGVAQFGNNGSAPPRKQIIGFAKFRTRQEAVSAKELLQGKRIDMEKGAVLKAEMAKKNLHTKRGVGTMPAINSAPTMTNGATNLSGIGTTFSVYQQSSVNGFGHGSDPYIANGADSLSAPSGLGLGRINQTLTHEPGLGLLREREEDEARRRESSASSMGFASMSIRGTRMDDEDRERRRDKEVRPRNGLSSFDPFNTFSSHSYADIMRSSLSTGGSANGVLANGLVPQQDETIGPWDNLQTANTQQSSARSTSPSVAQLSASSLDNGVLTIEQRQSSGPISPGVRPGGLIDSNAADGEGTKSSNGLSLTTATGDTSPQLPSPASNTSSNAGRSIDQNPPINTLYVGNLPSGAEHLEDRLRGLFSTQLGFRRLCFRQKNNGPMCFVEFEDVNFATKTLHNLNGQTLNGLVKGTGIRLSYSKNPLGVRTPTGAGGQLQQQQSQHAADILQSKLGDDSLQSKPVVVRRDANTVSSPSGSSNVAHGALGNSFLASPPPRFISSSPSNSQHVAGSVIPRHSTSNILNPYNPPMSFAPFGFPSTSQPMIPDHITPSDDLHSANSHNVQQHFHSVISTPAANLEAARAG